MHDTDRHESIQSRTYVSANDIIAREQNIAIRLGIDDDAENKGGLNIFGRGFGNRPHDILPQIDYMPR